MQVAGDHAVFRGPFRDDRAIAVLPKPSSGIASCLDVIMRLAAFLLLLLTACGEPAPPRTATIEPAGPSPAPPPPAMQTVGEDPVITTSGSPLPGDESRAGLFRVVIHDGRIEAPKSVRRGQVAFQVINRGTAQHGLLVGQSDTPEGAQASLPPGQEMVLQLELTRAQYDLWCPVQGHNERATIATYKPR